MVGAGGRTSGEVAPPGSGRRGSTIQSPPGSCVDTWTTMGMRGTGSHDFTADGVHVGSDWSFSIFEHPELDFTLLRIPELCLSTMAFAAPGPSVDGAPSPKRDSIAPFRP